MLLELNAEVTGSDEGVGDWRKQRDDSVLSHCAEKSAVRVQGLPTSGHCDFTGPTLNDGAGKGSAKTGSAGDGGGRSAGAIDHFAIVCG